MNILLTNDDGYKGEGIKVLAETLSKKHNVFMIAPLTQKSACSHALTTYTPQKLVELNKNMYAFDGTPADCVKMAINIFKDIKFDILLSGINQGENMGTDIIYSGTISGAREGASNGLKSIALSSVANYNNNFEYIADFVLENLDKLMALDFENTFWNMNFPNIKREEVKGVLFCKLGIQKYDEFYDTEMIDGEKHYSLKGEPLINPLNDLKSDVGAVSENYISLTPMILDTTEHSILNKYKDTKF